MYPLLAICLLLLGIAGAQPLPLPSGIPLTTATVSVTITSDISIPLFHYSYVVSNSGASRGTIYAFTLDISTTPGGFPLSSQGLENSATGYRGFGPLESKLTNAFEAETVPISFESQPPGWHSGPTAQMMATWYGLPPSSLPIPAGKSQGPFVIASHGLPGIRKFIAEPPYNPDDFIQKGIDDPDVGPAEAQQIVDLDRAIQAAIRSEGFTLGPVSAPSLTDAGILMDRLASLKHQAFSLGWIYGPGADGIVQSLDAKLDAAKASLARGDRKTAANQLNAFIRELQAQRGKHVSDNAYYLLATNAQYILTKLGP